MARSRRLDAACGFSLLEMLIAMLLTLVLMISLYKMLDLDQKILRTQQEVTAMQQNGRAAMDFICRDLVTAGVNRVGNELLEEAGVIYPNADSSNTFTTDAITIWTHPGNTKGTVDRDMPQPSSEIVLDSVDLFTTGDPAIIIGLGSDGRPHYDLFTITNVQFNPGEGEQHLQHRPPINESEFSTSYQAGSKVFIAEVISYFIADNGSGVKEIYRRYHNQPPSPVAEHVTDLHFSYFAQGVPPPELTAIDSAEKRLAIRKVKVELTVETERRSLLTGSKRRLPLQSEVSPRNLIYKRAR